MKIRLVKHVVDANEEKVSFQLYRDVTIPFIPHTGLIVQDDLGSEYLQAMGYCIKESRFEALVFPHFVTEENSADTLKDKLEKTGWRLGKDKDVLIDFEGKLDEEQAIRDYIESDSEDIKGDPDLEGEEPNNWKQEHDKIYPEDLDE